jgi:hypothetical protein
MMRTIAVLILGIAAVFGADIRGVDFQNMTYRPACTNRKPVKVTNGLFQREGSPVDRLWFKVMSVEYGDLTGDGKEEAVVVTACVLGGTGNPTEGFIYAIEGGKAHRIAYIPEGDRAFGGIENVAIEGGLLKVTRKQGQAACCPETLDTTVFKLQGGRLVQVGDVVKKKIEPK